MTRRIAALLPLLSCVLTTLTLAGCSNRSAPPSAPSPEAVYAAAADAMARQDLPAFVRQLARARAASLTAIWIGAARHAERRQGRDEADVDALLLAHGCDPRQGPRELAAQAKDLPLLFAALDRFVQARWAPVTLETWEARVAGRLVAVEVVGDRAVGRTSTGRRCLLLRERGRWKLEEVR